MCRGGGVLAAQLAMPCTLTVRTCTCIYIHCNSYLPVVIWALTCASSVFPALSACPQASYVALLNLPLRRAEIKSKMARVANNFVADVQKRMKDELDAEVAAVIGAVGKLLAPLEEACAAEVARLEAREAQLADLNRQLEEVGRKIANIQ